MVVCVRNNDNNAGVCVSLGVGCEKWVEEDGVIHLLNLNQIDLHRNSVIEANR